MLALAAARNASGASVNRAYLGDPATSIGSASASSSANSALTRHYLQLLQSRQGRNDGFGAPNNSGEPPGRVNDKNN